MRGKEKWKIRGVSSKGVSIKGIEKTLALP
jgi:hypothetical protein